MGRSHVLAREDSTATATIIALRHATMIAFTENAQWLRIIDAIATLVGQGKTVELIVAVITIPLAIKKWVFVMHVKTGRRVNFVNIVNWGAMVMQPSAENVINANAVVMKTPLKVTVTPRQVFVFAKTIQKVPDAKNAKKDFTGILRTGEFAIIRCL